MLNERLKLSLNIIKIILLLFSILIFIYGCPFKLGEPFERDPKIQLIASEEGYHLAFPLWSSDDFIYYVKTPTKENSSYQNVEIMKMKSDGSEQTTLANVKMLFEIEEGWFSGWDISPDGKEIVVSSVSLDTLENEVFNLIFFSTDSAVQETLSPTSEKYLFPKYNPEGTKIYYFYHDIWRINRDGTGNEIVFIPDSGEAILDCDILEGDSCIIVSYLREHKLYKENFVTQNSKEYDLGTYHPDQFMINPVNSDMVAIADGSEHGVIILLSLSTGSYKTVDARTYSLCYDRGRYISWSPNGDDIVFNDGEAGGPSSMNLQNSSSNILSNTSMVQIFYENSEIWIFSDIISYF